MNLTQNSRYKDAPIRDRILTARRGNLLVGCGVVLLIFIILLGIGGYYVATNWRGWTANQSTKLVDGILTQAEIDPDEHAELMVHVNGLMTRFENKEVTLEQLGEVLEQLVESPVVPSALVIALDNLYITPSDLPDDEKAQARIDFARYTQGLFDETIPSESVNEVLEPVITTTPDKDDIKLNLRLDQDGSTITALKSSDKVSTEELRTLIANAKAQADEAGVTATPTEIDLSDELGKAIGITLGEIDSEPVNNSSNDSADPSEDPADDQAPTDDGP